MNLTYNCGFGCSKHFILQIWIWLSWLLEANKALSILNTREETGHLREVDLGLGRSLIVLPEPRSQTLTVPLSSGRQFKSCVHITMKLFTHPSMPKNSKEKPESVFERVLFNKLLNQ